MWYDFSVKIRIKEITITMTIAGNINILGNYCGKRDVEELTIENLQKNVTFHRQM